MKIGLYHRCWQIIVFDELNKELERIGHRFFRYSGDCNIYVKPLKAEEIVMERIKRFITQKLPLKVNETKSKIAKSREYNFTCYTIENDGKLWIVKKIKERMKKRTKELARRNRGRELKVVIGEPNRTFGGWLVYFRLANAINHIETMLGGRVLIG